MSEQENPNKTLIFKNEDHELKLTIIGYQHPNIDPEDDARLDSTDEEFYYDANWLIVDCEIKTPNLQHSFKELNLLTTEVNELWWWIGCVCQINHRGSEYVFPKLTFKHPNLSFNIVETHHPKYTETLVISIMFEVFNPVTNKKENQNVEMKFLITDKNFGFLYPVSKTLSELVTLYPERFGR